MNGFVLAVVTLLILAPVALSITCYCGPSNTGAYNQTAGFDICYSVTSSGVTTKGGYGTGNGVYTCTGVTGVSCCATNLCNGAKMNGMSMVMTIAAVAMIGLFRAM